MIFLPPSLSSFFSPFLEGPLHSKKHDVFHLTCYRLHQLFLEERIENGTSDSARHVKLKRRLNGFPFDSRSGKSYMEKFLKSPSPDHEKVHEIPVDSSPLALPSSNTYDSALEIVEISVVSPEKESKQRMRSPSSSPTREGNTLELAVHEVNEFLSTKGISEVSKSNPGLEANDLSTLHKVASEKEIVVDSGIKTEGCVDDDQSDDFASEIDNYVDALTTMESEMDTDSELRSKNDLRYTNRRSQASDLDANGERVQAHSSDSLSIGNSTLSDDANSSSKKDLSSFSYSDSHSISAENTPSDGEVSSNVFTSTEINEAEASLTQKSVEEEGKVSQPPGGAVSNGAFTKTVEISSHSFELGDPTATSSPSDSDPVSKNAEAVVKEIASVGPETDEMVANLSRDPPFIPSISDVWEQKGDLSPNLSGGNQHLDEFEDKDTNTTEKLDCTSYLSVPSPPKDGFPLQLSVENKFDDVLQDEDVSQEENLGSTSDCFIIPDAMDINPSQLSSENQPLDELQEDPNWRDNASSVSNPSDALLHGRDDLSPKMSAEELPVDDLTVEDHFLLDAPICTSNIMEAATEKKSTETMPENVPQIGHAEDTLVQNSVENQICPQNLVIPLTKDLSISPINTEFETHYSNVEPVERVSEASDASPLRAENVTFKEDTPIICESVDSFVSGTTADIPTLEASKERNSYLREEYFDEPSDVGDGALMDEAASDPDLLERVSTPEPSLMTGGHVHLNEVDCESVGLPAAVAGQGHYDHAVVDDDNSSSVDLKNLQGGSLSSAGDEHNGLETETCFLDRPDESDITEDRYDQKFVSPDLNSLCNTVIVDDSGPQILDASVPYVVLGSGSSLNLGTPLTCQLSVQHNEQELLEEKVDLQPKELDDKLLNEGEANSELSNQLQQTHYSNHDDQLGPFDASSESLLVNNHSQPSASEHSSQGNIKIDVSEHLLDPSLSISSAFSLLSDSNQIYVEEMPPLPPLPPVQWRMGKLQHANPTPEGVSANSNATAFLPLLPSSANQEAQTLNPFLPQSALAHDKSTPVSEQPILDSSPYLLQVPPMVHDAHSEDNILPLEEIQSTRTFLQLPISRGEMLQNDLQTGDGEKVQTTLGSFSNASAVEATSADVLGFSHEEAVKPLNQMPPETSLSDIKLGQCSAHSEENIVTCDTAELPSNVADEHAMPTSEEHLSWPTAEDSKLHGIRTMKLPRPRNPLIDAVAAHDKSKVSIPALFVSGCFLTVCFIDVIS